MQRFDVTAHDDPRHPNTASPAHGGWASDPQRCGTVAHLRCHYQAPVCGKFGGCHQVISRLTIFSSVIMKGVAKFGRTARVRSLERLQLVSSAALGIEPLSGAISSSRGQVPAWPTMRNE